MSIIDDSSSLDFATSIYRFQDSIANLQIKVTLRKRSAEEPSLPLNAPPLQDTGDTKGMTEMKELGLEKKLARTISNTFKWQAKSFSPKEVEYYRVLDDQVQQRGDDLLRSLPPVQVRHLEDYQRKKMMHQQQGKGPVKGHVLYSLIDEDESVSLSQLQTASPSIFGSWGSYFGSLFHHSTNVPELSSTVVLKHRDQEIATGTGRLHPQHGVAGPNQATLLSKPVRGFHRHLHETPFKTMTIVSALRSKTDPTDDMGRESGAKGGAWDGTEHVLCTIRAYENGTLEMRPGFSTDLSVPYPLQTLDNNTIYEYFIENISASAPDKSRTQAAPLPERVGASVAFATPPDQKSLRIHTFGEIVFASGFSEESLFVEYIVDAAPSWRNASGNDNDNADSMDALLSAATQVSDSKPVPGDPFKSIAYFCFPFEFHLEGPQDAPLPKVFFVVNSYDQWDRYNALGYGYITIPHSPGHHQIDIQMWKPRGSLRSQLRSFFIGGSAELQDVKYAASSISNNYSANRDKPPANINKYGFMTVTSGALRVRVNNSIHVKPEGVMKEPSTTERMLSTSASFSGSNLAVLNALQRAKLRLESMRKFRKDQ